MNINYFDYGYVKTCLVTPEVFIANPQKNLNEHLKHLHSLKDKECAIIAFPELSLCGYTSEDLFLTPNLLNKTKEALKELADKTKNHPSLIVVGAPCKAKNNLLYNCAYVFLKGELLGIIPKSFIPNYKEFYELRWFTPGKNLDESFIFNGKEVSLSRNQLFCYKNLKLGIEICEDLWAVTPPSNALSLAGANVILNLSASNETVTKADYRKKMIEVQSQRLLCAYLYVSSGPSESTKDIVFSSHRLVADCGSVVAEDLPFNEKVYTFSTIDLEKIISEKNKNKSLFQEEKTNISYKKIKLAHYYLSSLEKSYSPSPFTPSLESDKKMRANEILNIQAYGLIKRIKSSGAKKLLLGLSGGLDSTLAAMVAVKALKIMNRPLTDLLAISMPGLATSDKTKKIALELSSALECSFKEISISESANLMLSMLFHTGAYDSTYENAQARVRTEVLFNMANKEQGLVIGTGNLSELALGWCTYNGDHMSHYGVNSSIPKTLVKMLVSYEKENYSNQKIFETILANKISPELIPGNDKDEISQDTEGSIGPYQINDFILFHFVKYGFSEEKILLITLKTMKDLYSEELIQKTSKSFFSRFYAQQFKRSTLPPGPKVGSVSLSPRGDWRMPDEVDRD